VESLCVVLQPEVELEILCGMLDVEQIVHKVT
jgi:hypothetical protein